MNFFRNNAAGLLLAGATLGWYVASHAASGALAGRRLAIGRIIVGHWMPILVTAMLATLLGRHDVAIAVLFATSVAVLSLVLGIVTCSHDFSSPSTAPGGFPVIEPNSPNVLPIGGASVEGPEVHWRRIWAFVLPASLLVLLAGFTGALSLNHALTLAIEGIVILALWTTWPKQGNDVGPDRHPAIRVIELLFAIALAVVAAWAALRATGDMSRRLGLISGGFVASLLLAPALVLPMIGTGMNLARENLYPAAVTSCVAIVLLNLCLGLPAMIVLWNARPVWDDRVGQLVAAVSQARPTPATAPVGDLQDRPELRFPLAAWRVDTVILIVLGLVLLPLSIGRWLPGRFEGALLVFVYVVYMGLTTFAARA